MSVRRWKGVSWCPNVVARVGFVKYFMLQSRSGGPRHRPIAGRNDRGRRFVIRVDEPALVPEPSRHITCNGKDVVLVGRVGPDPSDTPDRGRHERFSLFLAGDQLRKGAALNALQIAAGLGG